MKLLATFTGPLASITKRLLSAVNCPNRNFCTNPASFGWSAGHSKRWQIDNNAARTVEQKNVEINIRLQVENNARALCGYAEANIVHCGRRSIRPSADKQQRER